MDTIRKKVEPFQEEDDRCIFEFLQQIAPLDGLPQRIAVEMLTQELLDPEIQRRLPKPVFSVDEVRSYLLGEFGNLTQTIEDWRLELDAAACLDTGTTQW